MAKLFYQICDNIVFCDATEDVQLAIHCTATMIFPRNTQSRHYFPLLGLNVEAFNTVEDSRIVLATGDEHKPLPKHTAQSRVTPILGHGVLLSNIEASLVYPAAALSVAFTHLEQLVTDLSRKPSFVIVFRLVAMDNKLIIGALFISRNIDDFALI